MTVMPLFSSPFGDYRRSRIINARLLYQPKTREFLRHVLIASAANEDCCRSVTNSPACWIDRKSSAPMRRWGSGPYDI